ncbi:MAG TPA: class I SAM-dependent methyltransferase family protein [Ktedonobacteraceae bacterium]|nr:class I SAM-dependent methyltransferase family protein [Ktedonobacteraceae bacterium]
MFRYNRIKKYGSFGPAKWALMCGLLSTVRRMSKGVRIGYTYGFDSDSMLDYIYVNKAHGIMDIGKLIDRLYLNTIGCRAIRVRRVLLEQLLQKEVDRNQTAGIPTCLLDVAAGPGHFLQEF